MGISWTQEWGDKVLCEELIKGEPVSSPKTVLFFSKTSESHMTFTISSWYCSKFLSRTIVKNYPDVENVLRLSHGNYFSESLSTMGNRTWQTDIQLGTSCERTKAAFNSRHEAINLPGQSILPPRFLPTAWVNKDCPSAQLPNWCKIYRGFNGAWLCALKPYASALTGWKIFFFNSSIKV